MTQRDEPSRNPRNPRKLQITAVTVDDAAKILASAFGRRITAEQVRQVVEAGGLEKADGTFSLLDYVAYLAREVTSGNTD